MRAWSSVTNYGWCQKRLICLGATALAALLPLKALAQSQDLQRALGPFAQTVPDQLMPGWQGYMMDGWYILENPATDKAEQILALQPGTAPADGRRFLAEVVLDSEQSHAAIGLITRGENPDDVCVVEITAAQEASLFCVIGGEFTQYGKVAGGARMDGNDLIEIVEIPGAARFYINNASLGEVTDPRALGHQIGIMAYGIGRFGVGALRVENATNGGDLGPIAAPRSGAPSNPPPPSAPPPAAQDAPVMGELAALIEQTPLSAGFERVEDQDWLILENQATASVDQVFLKDFGAVPRDGRVFSVRVGIIAPDGADAANLPHSALGLYIDNRSTNAGCVGEITLGGDGLVLCFDPDGKAREVARAKGAARMDGTDVLSFIEFEGAAAFGLNDQILAEFDGDAALGGSIGLIAYERARFFFTDFTVNMLNAEGKVAASSAPPTAPQDQGAAIDPAFADVQGEGALPNFGGDRERMIGAYVGVANSILLHEFGHALIGELQLPSTGPEEDAVDIFSALQVVEPTMFPGEDENLNRMGTEAASYAALQWYYSGKLGEQSGVASQWQDEHTADLKRFRNVFCVIYGGNPSLFEDIASGVGLDERTLSRCHDEFGKQNRAWRAILAPHTRIDHWHPEGMQPKDAPGAPVTVVFEPSRYRLGNMMREVFGTALQSHVEGLGQIYVLPRPLQVTFRDCDMLNAWYDPRSGDITMCYDLMLHMLTMISDIEMGTVNGFPPPAEGGAAAASAPQAGGAPSQPFGSNANAPAKATIDEAQDFGVPVTMVLFPAPYRGPTPVSHAKAQVVDTPAVQALLAGDPAGYLLIDTSGAGESLPGAVSLPEAGRDGSLTDGFQAVVKDWLTQVRSGGGEIQFVFIGKGLQDRSSYNAALRAAHAGANALWYRGGTEAWQSAGLGLAPVAKAE